MLEDLMNQKINDGQIPQIELMTTSMLLILKKLCFNGLQPTAVHLFH